MIRNVKPNNPLLTRGGFVLFLLFLVCATPAAFAQESEDFTLSVDVNQVVLTVTVENKKGEFTRNLKADDFIVLDQGEPQELVDFSSASRPVTVGLVVDNSRSMGPKRVDVVNAATTFAAAAAEQDEFFVIHFSDEPRFGLDGVGSFTHDFAAVRRALWDLKPSGQTSLYDAVSMAIDHAEDGQWDKRALLVISDGGDNASATEFEPLLETARRSDTMIYSIGVFTDGNPDKAPSHLKKLARASGAMALFPKRSTDIVAACNRIAEEIRRQYTLAYVPSVSGGEGYHDLEVRLKPNVAKGQIVRVRDGYYAGDEPSREVADAR